MKSEDIIQLQFTTTPEPVRSGRNGAFYPILLVRPEKLFTIYKVMKRYYSHEKEKFARHPHDNGGQPIESIYDIIAYPAQKIARYRWHEELGWLEEVTSTWSVTADYPTIEAIKCVSSLADQGAMNVAVAMRFGVQLVAILLGDDSVALKAEVLKSLMSLMDTSPAPEKTVERITVNDQTITLTF